MKIPYAVRNKFVDTIYWLKNHAWVSGAIIGTVCGLKIAASGVVFGSKTWWLLMLLTGVIGGTFQVLVHVAWNNREAFLKND